MQAQVRKGTPKPPGNNEVHLEEMLPELLPEQVTQRRKEANQLRRQHEEKRKIKGHGLGGGVVAAQKLPSSFSTDGVGLCIHYRNEPRPKNQEREEAYERWLAECVQPFDEGMWLSPSADASLDATAAAAEQEERAGKRTAAVERMTARMAASVAAREAEGEEGEDKERWRRVKKQQREEDEEKVWEEEQGWIWKGRPPGLRKEFSRAPPPLWLEEILEGPTEFSSRCGQHKRRTSGLLKTSPSSPAGCASKASTGLSKTSSQ